MPRKIDTTQIMALLSEWSKDLGFEGLASGALDLNKDHHRLLDWLKKGFHGNMNYMGHNLDKRLYPKALFPGTFSVVCVRMQYKIESIEDSSRILKDPQKAYISRYALGRDYHKTLRSRLKTLGKKLEDEIGPFGHRVFTDSAPILERALARTAGLGWVGKNTMLIHPKMGSYFFLGELFTDLALPTTFKTLENKCGSCNKCIDICPTKAILGPYEIDARKCISYLTIEHKENIPIELRPLIGNRIFGCDDCQLVCPWNKYAKSSPLDDFKPRHNLANVDLLKLFQMDATDFDNITIGSALRRISYEQWLRNIAISLGNATPSANIIRALNRRSHHKSALVREHVRWAIKEQERKLDVSWTGANKND